jgi:chromosome segregation ATPase
MTDTLTREDIANPFTPENILEETQGIPAPEKVRGKIKEKRRRLESLNDDLDAARERVKEARSELVQAEMSDLSGEGGDVEAADQRLTEAQQDLKKKEDLLDARADALRDSIEELQTTYKVAVVRERARQAKALNDRADDLAAQLRSKIDDLRDLATELADVETEAHTQFLDGDFHELRIGGRRASGLNGAFRGIEILDARSDERKPNRGYMGKRGSLQDFLKKTDDLT